MYPPLQQAPTLSLCLPLTMVEVGAGNSRWAKLSLPRTGQGYRARLVGDMSLPAPYGPTSLYNGHLGAGLRHVCPTPYTKAGRQSQV